jgi:hypothetical protein
MESCFSFIVGGSGFQLVGVAKEVVEPEETVEQEGDREGRPVDGEGLGIWRYPFCSAACIVAIFKVKIW